MDKLWKMLGLLALLLLLPVIGHANEHMGRGFMICEGRGYLLEGRGFAGRGSPVAMWNYSDQKDWSCGECGIKNEYWKDRCWNCNKRRSVVQPHDDL